MLKGALAILGLADADQLISISIPAISLMPDSAAAAVASLIPLTVSWSVRARVPIPVSAALRTRALGLSEPSDSVEWLCKSIIAVNLLDFSQLCY